jgi:hypothetical protein
LVALLVAELERNLIPPCGRGLHADVGKLREQIKSAAATSGTTRSGWPGTLMTALPISWPFFTLISKPAGIR